VVLQLKQQQRLLPRSQAGDTTVDWWHALWAEWLSILATICSASLCAGVVPEFIHVLLLLLLLWQACKVRWTQATSVQQVT